MENEALLKASSEGGQWPVGSEVCADSAANVSMSSVEENPQLKRHTSGAGQRVDISLPANLNWSTDTSKRQSKSSQNIYIANCTENEFDIKTIPLPTFIEII
jgi:hypothetical protein